MLAPAAGVVTVPLKLDQLRKLEMSFEIRRASSIASRLSKTAIAPAIRLAIDMPPDEMVWPPGLIQIGPNLCYRCLLKF
jgi:hypothetical protein